MTIDVFLTRTAAFLPFSPVDNEEMEARLGQVGGRPSRARRLVLRSNGIESRHYAIDPTTGAQAMSNAQLTAQAVRALGDVREIGPVDLLATGTSLPDQLMPGHGVMVHGELGWPRLEVVSCAGVCLAGTAAFKHAWLAVRAGDARRAVATGSELASAHMRGAHFAPEIAHRVAQLESRPEIAFEKDFLRWMLSDGAGAVWLQDRPNAAGLSLRIDWIDILSFADQMPPCMYAGAEMEEGGLIGWSRFDANERNRRSVMAIKQDVKLLNDNIVRVTVVEALRRILHKRELRAADIDHFLPHYSSEFFRERLAEGLAEADLPIPQERWFTNLTSKGNTGAASIFIILEELFNGGRLRRGERLLCYVPESGRFSSAFMHLTVVGDEA